MKTLKLCKTWQLASWSQRRVDVTLKVGGGSGVGGKRRK